MHKSKTFSDVLDQMYVKMFHIPSQTLFFVLGEKKRSLGRDYHPLCLKCQKCMRTLTAGQHAEVDKMAFKYKNWEQMGWMGEWENAISTVCMFQHDEKPYCSHCYLRMFCSKGTAKRTNLHASPAGTPHLSVWISLDRYLVTGVSPAAEPRAPSATLTSAKMNKCRKTKDTPRPETIGLLIK